MLFILTKDNFFFPFLMLPNSEKHGKLSLHKVFYQIKQSFSIRNIYQRVVGVGLVENKRV